MRHSPRVSFVVPSFNEPPDVISASLASVRAQTFADFECLVVDESTDLERARVCRACCDLDPRFVYVRPEGRLGLPASLNLGMQQARGEFIARFDSDDVCLPDRLALQLARFHSQPELSVLGGALEIIDDDDSTIAFRGYPPSHAGIARGMQLTNTLAHPTVMFRRRAVEAHGGYDPSFRFSEDLDLWLRWLNAGLRFANLEQVLVRYRQKWTRRRALHWRFNLRARQRNFAWPYAGRRLVGICAIGTWMVLPTWLQEVAFRALLLRREIHRAGR